MPDFAHERAPKISVDQLELKNWLSAEGPKPFDVDKRSGLPAYNDESRQLFNDLIFRTKLTGGIAAVVKVDLETLKKLNEEYGDRAGDIGIDSQNSRAIRIMNEGGEKVGVRTFLLRRPGTRSDELFGVVVGDRNEISNIVQKLNSDFVIEIEQGENINIHSNAVAAYTDELTLDLAGDPEEVAKFPIVGLERISDKRLSNLKLERKLLILDTLIAECENVAFPDFVKNCVKAFSNVGMPPGILEKLLGFTWKHATKPYLERLTLEALVREMKESLN